MADQERTFLPEGFAPTPSLSDIIQDDSISFRERLSKRFKPNQFVRVMNIDTEPFEWQEVPASSEYVHQPDRVTYDVYRKPPTKTVLEPGQQKILEGGSAYLMVEGLFKKMVQKGSSGKRGSLAAMNSPQSAEQFISDIVIGVEDLASLTNPRPQYEAAPVPDASETVLDDLGLSDEKPRRGRRPAQA